LRVSVTTSDARWLLELLDEPIVFTKVDRDDEPLADTYVFAGSRCNLTEFFGRFDAVPWRDRLVLQYFIEELRTEGARAWWR
jgi:hypothetical protein